MMLPPYSDTSAAESANIQILPAARNMQKHRENMRKYTAGGIVIFALLVLLPVGIAQPARAQVAVTPTPNPASSVDALRAERAEMQRKLAEINGNIERQVADAERAANEARNAAAAQNGVEFGAAIGRLEGAIGQLRASYAGKDAIISDMAARIDQQAAQHITDTRTIDGLTADLTQARMEKKNAVDAYNALNTTRQADADNEMASNAVWIIAVLTLILSVLAVVSVVIQRRPVRVVDPPAEPAAPALEVIESDYTINQE